MKNLFRNTTAIIMAIALVAVAATISNLTTGKAGAAPDYAVIGHIDTDKLNSDFPMLKTAWEAVAAKKAELEKELNKKAASPSQGFLRSLRHPEHKHHIDLRLRSYKRAQGLRLTGGAFQAFRC